MTRETICVVGLTTELIDEIHEPLRAGLPAGKTPTSTLIGVETLWARGYLIEVNAGASVRRPWGAIESTATRS